MKPNRSLFRSVVVLLGCAIFLPVAVLAGHFDGGAGAGDPSWNNALNWSDDLVPTSATGVQAIDAYGALGYGVEVRNAGATAGGIDVGTWGHPGLLTVTSSGSLSVAGALRVAMDSETNSTLTTAGEMTVGGNLELNVGNSFFNMNGGTVDVAGSFLMTEGGTGVVHLYGGTLTAGGLGLNGNGGYTIDITEGVLVAGGNHAVGMNWMASVGLITAYGGEGEVYVEYNASADQTTLYASMVSYGPIAVENGGFTVEATGAQFFPVGFNYIDLRTNDLEHVFHDTFNPNRYDDATVSSNLAEIATAGFNTVRVFVDSGVGSESVVLAAEDTELSAGYMQRVGAFLEHAHAQGIYVLITFSHFPATSRYYSYGDTVDNVVGMNIFYLNPGYIAGQRTFIRDFIQTLKTLAPARLADTVFAFDPQNEVTHYIDNPPFILTSGTVTPANGVTYDLATERVKLADEMAVYWTDQMAEEIHLQAPGVLVDINAFTYDAVGRSIGDFQLYGTTNAYHWQDRYPFCPEALAQSNADFYDMHAYTKDAAALQAEMDSIEIAAVSSAWSAAGKPMIVGEFGAFKDSISFAEAVIWKRDEVDVFAAYGFQGWLYWTYENDIQVRLWHSTDETGEIFDVLAEGAQANYFTSPGPRPIILDSSADGAEVQLQWSTESGKTYQVLRSESLTEPVWRATGDPVPATSSTTSLTTPDVADQGFYKVRLNR